MLNNQNLSNKHIDYVPYQLQVGIFDAKCKDCIYAAYQVRSKTGIMFTYKDYEEAISYATGNRAPLKRLCTFNDESITLAEIVHNHCMFWDDPPPDLYDEEVREIDTAQLTELKYRLYKLESFVKLKE